MNSSPMFIVDNSTTQDKRNEIQSSRTAGTHPKKSRTVFTKKQILRLEAVFYEKRYLTIKDREELSKSLSLSESQVRHFSPCFLYPDEQAREAVLVVKTGALYSE